MKNPFKRSKKVNKGAPSGFVISLIFHAVIFFLAGLLVVFSVTKNPEVEFTAPPPVERPKMNLKKPRVKIKKSSQPKPSSRIVAKVKTAKMPEVQLPDLVGTGDGLLGGVGMGGEFMDIPDIGEMSVMGTTESVGTDLVGTYYDFKRRRDGTWNGMAIKDPSNKFAGVPASDKQTWLHDVYRFVKSGLEPTVLTKYYRSPRKLYSPCIVIPTTYSSVAPAAFDTIDSGGSLWMVHYTGKLVHKEGITFRFVCACDYFIIILVDGKIVWGGVWYPEARWSDYMDLLGGLYDPKLETRRGFIGNDRCMAGEWITLEPGVAKTIDILIGDENGKTSFCVAVEEKGVEYEKNKYGNPIYPIFKTEKISRDMLDQIYRALPEGEVSVTNGPVFNDL